MIAVLRRIGSSSAALVLCVCCLLAMLVGVLAGPADAATPDYGSASTLASASALKGSQALAISSDDSTLYSVASEELSDVEDQLDSISTSDGTFTELSTSGLDGPQDVAVSSLGYVYVANADDYTVDQLNSDGSSYASWGSWDLDELPTAVAVSPDGGTLYVAEYESGAITIQAFSGLPDYSAESEPETVQTNLSSSISSLAISPDGETVYAVSNGVVDCASSSELADFSTCYTPSSGDEAFAVALSPDGETLYVTDDGGNVLVVDSATDQTLDTLHPGGAAFSGVAASGTTLYALDDYNGRIDEWTIPALIEEPFSASIDDSGNVSVDVALADSGGTPTYEWYDDGTPIDGATTATLSSGQYTAGDTVAVNVCDYDPGWSGGCAEETIMYPGTPSIDDGANPIGDSTPLVGDTLTAETGGWGPGGLDPTFTYTWYVGDVEQGQGPHYTITGSDEGKPIYLTVTANETGYATGSASSGATTDVGPGTLAAPPQPTITGTARVGDTLTADTTGWSSLISRTYAWYANGIQITGQTHSTLKLTAAQYGKTITVRVSGTEEGYNPISPSTSAATARVALGSLTATPRPRITGRPVPGGRLIAHAGNWGPGKVQLRYQWLVGGRPIHGATGATLKLAGRLRGKRITVRVTGSETGYTPVSRTSASTRRVS